jgi:hypothetical protein
VYVAKSKKKHLGDPIQVNALRNGLTSGTPRLNIASNCATFLRSEYQTIKHLNNTYYYNTKRMTASKNFAGLWKWEANGAGSWVSKNLKNLKPKRSFSVYKE